MILLRLLVLVVLLLGPSGAAAQYQGMEVPNQSAATFPIQATVYANDWQLLAAATAGNGVLATTNRLDCKVTASGADMNVSVAACNIRFAGSTVAVSSGNVLLSNAHATLPRWDLISVNGSGVKTLTTGTAANPPLQPVMPTVAGVPNIALGAVYVPAADPTIQSNQIVDKRVWAVIASGGSGTPGGADSHVQFNDLGNFGGDAGLTFIKATDTLGLGTASSMSGKLQFRNAVNANTLTIQPGTTSVSHTWTLPPANAAGALTNDGSGGLTWTAAGGGSPAGSDTQVQFNDTGSFGADAGLTFAKATDTLGLGTASSMAGKLLFRNATNANTVTIQSGVTSPSYTLTLPTALPGSTLCFTSTNTGVMGFAACSGGGGSPGGADTQIQFNDGGVFAGDSALVWDKTNDRLGVGNAITTPQTSFHVRSNVNIPVLLETADSTTNTVSEIQLKHTTSGTMVDQFGVSLGFVVRDTVDNYLGSLVFRRAVGGAGPDDTGDFYLSLYKGGVNTIRQSILASGQAFFQADTGTALTARVADATTNTLHIAVAAQHNTTATMTDGFGTGYDFVITDADAAYNTIARIQATRAVGGAGADSTGAMALQTAIGGTLGNRVVLDGAGGVTIPGANLFLGTGAATAGKLNFFNATNSNIVTFQAGATASNITFTWPTAFPGSTLCFTSTTSGVIGFGACSGAGATPGGSDTHVQFNDAGSFGGDAGLTFVKSTDTLGLGTASSTSGKLQLRNQINSNTLTIQPGTTSSSHTWTLPPANASGSLTNDGSGNLSWAAGAGGAISVLGVTADQSITSITAANATGLAFTIAGTEVWQFQCYLRLNATSNGTDYKVQYTVPAGATMEWAPNSVANSQYFFTPVITSAIPSATFTQATVHSFAGLIGASTTWFSGWVMAGGTSGSVQLQISLVTAGTASTLKKGSVCYAAKVAT